MATAAPEPDELTNDLLEQLLRAVHDTAAPADRVMDAMRAVPRHRFVPDAPLTDAYADRAVITKRDADGTSLSCASVPSLVARMLDWLDVQPGHRVMGIGAGTGYNAALPAHLAGPGGHVTTVDIDEEVTARARRALDATGYERVEGVTGDGSLGHPQNSPYDRIIFTVEAWDLPPSEANSPPAAASSYPCGGAARPAASP
jgi:protein-L-isoaspartate(D-aspartate) O-methyltransferase